MMDIVIKISEEDYQLVKRGHIPFNILDKVRRGTPLPKGHGDLIDRNELLDWSYEIDSMYCVYDKVVNVDDINDAQTIIEADKEVPDEASN